MTAPDRSQSDSFAETHAACWSYAQLLLKLLASEMLTHTVMWEHFEN